MQRVKRIIPLPNGEYEIKFYRPDEVEDNEPEKTVSDRVAQQLLRHANTKEGAKYLKDVIKQANDEDEEPATPASSDSDAETANN